MPIVHCKYKDCDEIIPDFLADERGWFHWDSEGLDPFYLCPKHLSSALNNLRNFLEGVD